MKYILAIIAALAVTLGILIWSQQPPVQPDVAPTPTPTAMPTVPSNPTTVTGEYVCLPHKDTSGPQTMECAFGLQLPSGEYYALDFGDQGSPDQFQSGVTATLTGTLTPIEFLSTDQWQKYDIKGIFSVSQDSNLTQHPLIRLDTPTPESSISSPLKITGEARGTWFFEATFPVVLTNWDGLIIAEGYATATDDWMTEDFVPFQAQLTFDRPEYGDRGSLILQRSNPSGLPENDDALEITIYFK